MVFFSTFIVGFEDIVRNALNSRLTGLSIVETLDGLVIYQTTSSVTAVQKLRFLNNTFLLLSKKRSSTLEIGPVMERLFQGVDLRQFDLASTLDHVRTFRLMASVENQTVPIEANLRAKFEKSIARQLGLQVNRVLADVELWIIARREGLCLLGMRLTAVGRNNKRKYAKGELKQELAHLLCLVSEPNPRDVFLDPFCGSGAIVLERVKSFQYTKVLAGDMDANHVAAIRPQLARGGDRAVVGCWNALGLSEIPSASVDKIVTDPPWGFYQGQSINYLQFYSDMLAEFTRVMKPAGLMVILVGRKQDFETALSSHLAVLELLGKYDVLVSGKKAGVYKIRKLAVSVAAS